MTIQYLGSANTFHFKNLPGFLTVWSMVGGELVGQVYRDNGFACGTVYFPISK